jgi:hypothetical protein
MEIIRVQSIKSIPLIEEKLTFQDEKLKTPFLTQLAYTIQNNPASLMFLAAIEDGDIVGFVIAQDPGFLVPFITVAQLWNAPENSRSVVDSFFARIVTWALGLGKSFIRAETTRNEEAMYRRFRFLPVAQVITFDLSRAHAALVASPKEILEWAVFSDQT